MSIHSLAQQPKSILTLSPDSELFVRDLAHNATNEMYSTGYFYDSLVIDNDTYYSKGSSDIFIAKHTPTGNLEWIVTLGSTSEDRANALTLTMDGSIYVCGYFSSDFILPTKDTLKNTNQKDALLLKINSLGEIKWTHQIGSVRDDQFYDVITGINNEPIVCGYISGNIDITTSIGITQLTTSNANPFLEKLTTEGTVEWAKQLTTEGNGYAYGMHRTASNELLTTGHFSGSLTKADGKKISSLGAQDIFIARLSRQGNFLNQRAFGSSENDAGYAVTSNINGIYLAGNFSSQLILDNKHRLTSAGNRDAMVLRMDKDFEILNTSQISSTRSNQAYNLAVDGNSIYITGSFQGQSQMDGKNERYPRTALGNENVFTSYEDAYISKYNANLDLQWTQTMGSTGRDISTGISYNNGHIWVSGMLKSIEFPYINSIDTNHLGTNIIQIKDCNLSPTILLENGYLTPQENSAQVQWLECSRDLAEIEGKVNNTFLPDTLGYYSARISVDGCESITECYEYKGTVSIERLETTTSSVGPNPTRDVLYLSPKGNLLSVVVIDGLGKITYDGLPTDNKLETIDWLAGCYSVVLNTMRGQSVHKIIKL